MSLDAEPLDVVKIEQEISDKITQEFKPEFFEIENESHKHRSGTNASHFRLVIVSESFEGQRLIARHRAVNTLLAKELATVVHALALHTFTSAEWQKRGQQATISPNCSGDA